MGALGVALVLAILILPSSGNPAQKRLFDDLFANYNKLVRPVKNSSHVLPVMLLFKLTQILDVQEKNQVLRLNGFLIQTWFNHKLKWNPADYDNIQTLHIPGEMIWLPDIILYNNADGSPQVTTITKAHLFHTGFIIWEPPVIYNSMCEIDIEWFPFDEQFCKLKFGSWTYYGHHINLIFPHIFNRTYGFDEDGDAIEKVERAIEINEYQESGEWDLMTVRAIRHVKNYPCCDYPYIDITYYINIRRKTLFYAINLITPIVGIAFVSATVFYLPSDSNNKIVLSVSVLVSLALFFLLLTDIIPPTSRAIPLIAKYLLFTMLLVSFSIGISVITINIRYKAEMAIPMSHRVRKLFLDILPRVFFVYSKRTDTVSTPPTSLISWMEDPKSPFGLRALVRMLTTAISADNLQNLKRRGTVSVTATREYQRAYHNVCFIADRLRQEDERNNLKEDWKFVAMAIDRVFLILYTFCIVTGTLFMFMSPPLLRDDRVPISLVVKMKQANKSNP